LGEYHFHKGIQIDVQVAALWPLKILIVVAGNVLAGAFFSLIIALHVVIEKLVRRREEM